MKIDLQYGDCLELMKDIPDQSVDLILCDLPYGTTSCKWDSIIPLDVLWGNYWRVLKENGAVVLTAAQPFTTVLIASQLSFYKYSWIWNKSKVTGFMQAKNQPLRNHEDVCVFGRFKSSAQHFKGIYNPQGASDAGIKEYSNNRRDDHFTGNRQKGVSNSMTGYPRSVLEISSEGKTVHPTQKPVALMEYLIKTYTNEGDTVLDNCMGSGTTGVACVNTGRNFIGMEQEFKYFRIARRRIKGAGGEL